MTTAVAGDSPDAVHPFEGRRRNYNSAFYSLIFCAPRTRDVISLADDGFTSDSFSNNVAGKIAAPPASGSCVYILAKTLIPTSSHARRDRSRCIPQLKQPFTMRFTLDTRWYDNRTWQNRRDTWIHVANALQTFSRENSEPGNMDNWVIIIDNFLFQLKRDIKL